MGFYKGISTFIKKGELLSSSKDTYEIKELISTGLNQVYLAENSIGKEVAIKQFKFNKKEFLDFQYWLYDNIDHPFVDKPIDMFEKEAFHFQVKPFYKNYISVENLASNKIPFETKKSLILSIADFIKYLHSKNLAHTDLKPEQFIIVDKKIKLLDFDFGITDKFYFPGGTKEWYSPEHIKNERIDIKSDIFTFAEMAHWLLTSKHPFEQYFEKDFENAVLNGKYELSIYENIFSKMLKVEKSKRIDIEEFLKFFEVPKKLYLIMNGKKYLIVDDELITREKCKRNFKNYKEIAPKHFWILKKENGWFVKGLEDIRFNFVYVDGKNATNREIQIFDNSIIKIGNTEFKVKF